MAGCLASASAWPCPPRGLMGKRGRSEADGGRRHVRGAKSLSGLLPVPRCAPQLRRWPGLKTCWVCFGTVAGIWSSGQDEDRGSGCVLAADTEGHRGQARAQDAAATSWDLRRESRRAACGRLLKPSPGRPTCIQLRAPALYGGGFPVLRVPVGLSSDPGLTS